MRRNHATGNVRKVMAPELVLLAVGLTLWMVGMSTAPSEDDMQSIAHDPKRPDEPREAV